MGLLNSIKVKRYYQHIIDNVELDKENPKNSYIMWVHGKVDKIDFNKPAQITQGYTALPDIDSDFPTSKRHLIIEYLKNKYGEDRVAQLCTVQKIKGKSALKDVLRANDVCDFETMNKISSFIPDEAAITDELQEMMEETGESSIIKWALLNHEDNLGEYAKYDENENLIGEYAPYFEQAIRIENTNRQMGRHASGYIVSPDSLSTTCPMIYDKSTKNLMVGLEMKAAESYGLVKVDLLGINLLDKIGGWIHDINSNSTK